MEIIDPKQKQEFEQKYQQREVVPPNPMGRVLAGIIIMLVGGLLLARTMGIYFPDWFMHFKLCWSNRALKQPAKLSIQALK